jgi:glycosyltransferase involved in cell wall biosynthesis
VVLHVVESLGSGVATALEDYVRSTPAYLHIVLGWRRSGAQTGDALDRATARVLSLPRGRAAQFYAVHRWIRALRPDIVHAHSSYAGLYVRLAMPRCRGSVVYTPHGFAFERRDISRLKRAVFWLAEALCSLGGGQIAAVSPREAELARRLPGRLAVTYIPNVVRVDGQPFRVVDSRAGKERHLRVVTVGRISAQKDPTFLCRAARATQDAPVRWIWIGGGEAADERAIRDAGVEVTGWLPRSLALSELARADVYVHTAAWEGSPISVLEAAALGLPIVARRSPALSALELPQLCETPEALGQRIRALLDDDRRVELGTRCARLLEEHRPEAQESALEQAYRAASGRVQGC